MSAAGAESGSEVRNTAVPGARAGRDFFSIPSSVAVETLAARALALTIRVPRTQVVIRARRCRR